jgi:hypothetical protein
MSESRTAADAIEQALRDVYAAHREGAEPGQIVHDVRHGAAPTILPGRSRETAELQAARARLDAAVRRLGEALVAESIANETPT